MEYLKHHPWLYESVKIALSLVVPVLSICGIWLYIMGFNGKWLIFVAPLSAALFTLLNLSACERDDYPGTVPGLVKLNISFPLSVVCAWLIGSSVVSEKLMSGFWAILSGLIIFPFLALMLYLMLPPCLNYFD